MNACQRSQRPDASQSSSGARLLAPLTGQSGNSSLATSETNAYADWWRIDRWGERNNSSVKKWCQYWFVWCDDDGDVAWVLVIGIGISEELWNVVWVIWWWCDRAALARCGIIRQGLDHTVLWGFSSSLSKIHTDNDHTHSRTHKHTGVRMHAHTHVKI